MTKFNVFVILKSFQVHFASMGPDGSNNIISNWFVLLNIFRARSSERQLSCVVGHIPTKSVHLLRNKDCANFLKRVWCDFEDNNFGVGLDIDYWKNLEAILFKKLTYDSEFGVPIDT